MAVRRAWTAGGGSAVAAVRPDVGGPRRSTQWPRRGSGRAGMHGRSGRIRRRRGVSAALATAAAASRGPKAKAATARSRSSSAASPRCSQAAASRPTARWAASSSQGAAAGGDRWQRAVRVGRHPGQRGAPFAAPAQQVDADGAQRPGERAAGRAVTGVLSGGEDGVGGQFQRQQERGDRAVAALPAGQCVRRGEDPAQSATTVTGRQRFPGEQDMGGRGEGDAQGGEQRRPHRPQLPAGAGRRSGVRAQLPSPACRESAMGTAGGRVKIWHRPARGARAGRGCAVCPAEGAAPVSARGRHGRDVTRSGLEGLVDHGVEGGHGGRGRPCPAALSVPSTVPLSLIVGVLVTSLTELKASDISSAHRS